MYFNYHFLRRFFSPFPAQNHRSGQGPAEVVIFSQRLRRGSSRASAFPSPVNLPPYNLPRRIFRRSNGMPTFLPTFFLSSFLLSVGLRSTCDDERGRHEEMEGRRVGGVSRFRFPFVVVRKKTDETNFVLDTPTKAVSAPGDQETTQRAVGMCRGKRAITY